MITTWLIDVRNLLVVVLDSISVSQPLAFLSGKTANKAGINVTDSISEKAIPKEVNNPNLEIMSRYDPNTKDKNPKMVVIDAKKTGTMI